MNKFTEFRLPMIDADASAPYLAAMTVRPILTLPDARLRQKSLPVAAFDGELEQLIVDMFETMYKAPGIGLAAIQIGVARRVVTVDLARKNEPPAPQAFINPQILASSDELVGYEEGCLSIPEYYGEIERPARITVAFQDMKGNAHQVEAEGLLATVLQHEIDHLDGVLFIDHMSRLKRQLVIKKFAKAARQAEK